MRKLAETFCENFCHGSAAGKTPFDFSKQGEVSKDESFKKEFFTVLFAFWSRFRQKEQQGMSKNIFLLEKQAVR